ncbi:pentapeptide repeat-containing protein [Microcoleus sp. Aus8_D1]
MGRFPSNILRWEKPCYSRLRSIFRTIGLLEVKKAWTDAYGTIAAQMLQGAAQQAPPQVTQAQKTETSDETPAASETSPKSKTVSKTGFEQQFKECKAKASNLQWKTFPDRVLRRSIQAFWAAPVWLLAAIAAVTSSAIFVISDENSLVAKVLNGAETTSLILALVLFVKEAPDRRKQFHYQAWSAIDAAHGVKVSYARILALQDLNEDGVSLRGLDASGAEFAEIQLPKANLSNANLTEADLSNADLSNANLNQANLHQTKLSGVNLSGANLSFAKLHGANLSSANLSSSNLICADLSHANLSGANLRNANLSGASLAEAYLTGANLKGALVGTSELSAAFLEGAIMPDGSKYTNRQAG